MTHVFFGKNQFFDACPTPTTATMSLGTTLPYSLIFHCSNLDHTENSWNFTSQLQFFPHGLRFKTCENPHPHPEARPRYPPRGLLLRSLCGGQPGIHLLDLDPGENNSNKPSCLYRFWCGENTWKSWFISISLSHIYIYIYLY